MALRCICLLTVISGCSSLLFPQQSSTRDYRELDGLWDFVREPANSIGWGFRNHWERSQLAQFQNSTRIPVPCSFNEVTQNRALYDHVGWVWYQRLSPLALHIHDGFEWVNGVHLVNHTGGHLPFEGDGTPHLHSGLNTLTVAVNNTLSPFTVPSATFEYKADENRYPPGYFEQKLDMDFKNYAGIHRPVYLLLLPSTRISDVTVRTDFAAKGIGELEYAVEAGGGSVRVAVLDGVAALGSGAGSAGKVAVPAALPWWPLGMGQRPMAKLYTLQVSLESGNGKLLDEYRLEIGFRTVTVTSKQILINGKPFYCRGFGMHEDSEIRGRGFDWAVMVKDLNGLEWLGGNCFRTSHYPYAEQRFLEADRRGIAVIAETPGVGLRYWSNRNLVTLSGMLRELVARDKNHPSVIAWSLANEPQSANEKARPFFKILADLAHKLDSTRPVTIVMSASVTQDKTADLVDFVCVNRYYGWYIDSGRADIIRRSLAWDLGQWYKRVQRPIILTEYGAGSLPDVNSHPGVTFSEAYHCELLGESHKALDDLRKDPKMGLAGEMVWNFADFMTDPGVTRVHGNRKGIMKRNREPKMAAYVIQRRYRELGHQLGA